MLFTTHWTIEISSPLDFVVNFGAQISRLHPHLRGRIEQGLSVGSRYYISYME